MNIIPPVIVYTVDHIALFPKLFLKENSFIKKMQLCKEFYF